MKTRDFLLEIGTEELPPKSLRTLLDSLESSLVGRLHKAGLAHGDVEGFATPRRLGVIVRGLVDRQPDQSTERRGPSVAAAFDSAGKPTKAALGFARSCGVDDPGQLPRVETAKGKWLVYREEKPGRSTVDILGPLVSEAIDAISIERPMRWGASRTPFVRPVHWVVMLYGREVVPAVLFGLGAARKTMGHRFMSPGFADVKDANDYTKVLEKHKVIASFDERRRLIEAQLIEIGKAEKARVVMDDALLDEVTALVEWPVALCGSFDPAFLEVPEEALISAMTSHQRYFHLVNRRGRLIPRFVTVANIESKDPQAVIKGNERVITPRLADASFFYRQDSKVPLASRTEQLKHIVFQARLGSYYDKARRVSALAGHIAGLLDDDPAPAQRAGLLCKADLVTDMVGEFPELQGVMGGYYASLDGETPEVVAAIREHYLPTHSGGPLPGSRTGQCVAIADKLDTLTGLFGIGQPPTGSRDPFALRRQALGVIRICIECDLPLDVVALLERAGELHGKGFEIASLVDYLFERLSVAYQDAGIPVDTFNAVRNARPSTAILAEFDRQVRAVQAFRLHAMAERLVTANKRVANILKQVDLRSLPAVSVELFQADAESALFEAVNRVRGELAGIPDYTGKLQALAELGPTIDTYFDDVLVMDDDEQLRLNRMATLAAMREQFLTVADVSMLQIQGNGPAAGHHGED
jgi:glycyl-tRNA synthetase beta chain